MTSEISAAIASLRAASDIAKAMLGLNETIAIQAKVFELQAAILSAQQSALDANSAQSTLLERISGLEEELADLKTWDGEKQKYQLTEVGPGAFAFSLKPDSGSTEPAHSLCSNCYHDGRKAILQARRSNAKDILACLRCKEVIVVRNHVPMPPARVGGV